MCKPVAMLVKRTPIRVHRVTVGRETYQDAVLVNNPCHLVTLPSLRCRDQHTTPQSLYQLRGKVLYTRHAVLQESVISYNGILMRPQVCHLDLAVWDIEVGGNGGG